jgi:hypothetical protein
MKTSHAIFAIVLSTATLAGTSFAASPTDTNTQATTQAENWLKIPAIYDKVIAAGYSDINDIEREKDGYEIKARNADGVRVKLYVDPMTGEVLDSRTKSDKADKTRSDRTGTKYEKGDKRSGNDAQS